MHVGSYRDLKKALDLMNLAEKNIDPLDLKLQVKVGAGN